MNWQYQTMDVELRQTLAEIEIYQQLGIVPLGHQLLNEFDWDNSECKLYCLPPDPGFWPVLIYLISLIPIPYFLFWPLVVKNRAREWTWL